MTNKCRFCPSNSVELVYKASKANSRKSVHEFTLTNCGFGTHGPIVRCHNCHIYYVDEKIGQKKISTYYEIAEDPLYLAEQEARRVTFTHYLNKLSKFLPRKGTLLDIGTNTGLFVRLAKDNGWKAQGLEPNKESISYAREKYKIDLIAKPFEDKLFPKHTFDCITMWDVIEHFTNPIEKIKLVSDYLKPGGLFAFSTIDPESLLAKIMGTKWPWYMEMHRVFLTKEASRYYLEKSGFQRVSFTAHFRYLSLGYLSSRLQAISTVLTDLSGAICSRLGISKVIVPYYANDLFECYARK